MSKPSLVIRNGTIVDGSGGDPYEADLLAVDGRIAAIGGSIPKGTDEIDARGRLVTPGFVDVHTHYDAQVTWSDRLSPSSWNGATTVLFGNCGVGFAPCHEDQHDMLINLMEGVEDIPEVVLSEGTGTASPISSMRSPLVPTTSISPPRCRMPPCASM